MGFLLEMRPSRDSIVSQKDTETTDRNSRRQGRHENKRINEGPQADGTQRAVSRELVRGLLMGRLSNVAA